jgi:hypothetical protein
MIPIGRCFLIVLIYFKSQVSELGQHPAAGKGGHGAIEARRAGIGKLSNPRGLERQGATAGRGVIESMRAKPRGLAIVSGGRL